MRNYSFLAGYVIPAIPSELPKACGISRENLLSALKCLAHFSIEVLNDAPWILNDADERSSYNLIKVLYNQVLRGEPTFLPYDTELIFANRLGCLKSFEQNGNVGFEIDDINLLHACWHALHPIDPRLNRFIAHDDYQRSWENLDSFAEEDFLFQTIPQHLFNGHGDFLIQVIQAQRSLETMVDDPAVREGMQNNFIEQRADFVLEFPYPDDLGYRGICMEVDGPHHFTPQQSYLDNQRDTATQASGWHPTLRFPVVDGEVNGNSFTRVQTILKEHQAIQIYFQNYQQLPDLKALQLTLSPFGIARIQFALLRAILTGQLSMDLPVWRIGILEHDLPCAFLAIERFRSDFEQLATLSGEMVALPEIIIDVFVTPEFQTAELNEGYQLRSIDEIECIESGFYDLFIEISLLSKRHFAPPFAMRLGIHALRIHNSFHKGENQPFLFGPRITYRALCDPQTSVEFEEPTHSLRYFLRNIFRKADFRPGQLRILNLALQNQHVIGLLPTGGGKSLTYQIAGVLQPGLTLVIDPIKSLMKDQVDSLARMGISRTVYLNSSQTTEVRKQAGERMQHGSAMFCFISPERMLIPRFRNLLLDMEQQGRFFAYGVVDEAHCVSEWGHDFRTPYLALGRNLLRFCKAYGGERVTLFGLTATASYDVLADVQRELSGKRPGDADGDQVPDGHIIQHFTTNRHEIQYYVEEIPISINEVLQQEGQLSEKNIKITLGKKKQNAIATLIQNAAHKLREFASNPSRIVSEEFIGILNEGNQGNVSTINEIAQSIALPAEIFNNFWGNGKNAALVFAPHRSWVFGVTDRYTAPQRGKGILEGIKQQLNEEYELHFGTYLGAPQDDLNFLELDNTVDADNERNQTRYLQNDIDVMVATKAFGMGIDKPNIRLIIHDNYPGSIESFVQEAGRAGRDQKLALSVLLFNEQVFELKDKIEPDFDIQQYFFNNSFPGPIKEKRMIYELLTQIILPETNLIRLAQTLSVRLVTNEHTFILRYSTNFNALWLNDSDGNTYGYVRPHHNDYRLSHVTVPLQIAQMYLQELLQLTIDNNLNHIPQGDLHAWLNQRAEGGVRPGIETQLSQMTFGEQRSLVIPFKNALPEDDPKCRQKHDTDKAIYRLFLIGVIDDYTIDYAGHFYTVIFSKKLDELYKEYLKHYIDKFYPPKRVAEILNQIDERKGETEIQRILNYLIEFLYEEIAKKRRESILVMKELCRIGLKEGNIAMKTFIHLYFNSKYAREGYALSLDPEIIGFYKTLEEREQGAETGLYNCSLRDWTDRGRSSRPEWVLDFIRLMEDDYSGATLDNLKHLRGACTLLLVNNPDNATLRLLRAYALIVLANRQEPNQRNLMPIVEDLSLGFRFVFKELEFPSQYGDWIDEYRGALTDKTESSFSPILNQLLDLALVRMHTDWTLGFKKKLKEQLSSR